MYLNPRQLNRLQRELRKFVHLLAEDNKEAAAPLASCERLFPALATTGGFLC